jgi:hypothetical protein
MLVLKEKSKLSSERGSRNAASFTRRASVAVFFGVIRIKVVKNLGLN